MDGSGVGQYKKGDVVDAVPVGSPIGALEGLPHFIWVTVTDIDRGDVNNLLAPSVDENGDMTARRSVRMRHPDVDNVINSPVRPGRLTTTEVAFVPMLEVRPAAEVEAPGVINRLMFWR
jgi:hypothetical protein